MCGGGGSSGPTESTVTQTNLPEYAEPYYRDLLARTGYESAVPYQPYGGSRLKYFTPAEQTAMSRMNQLGVSGTPQELQAAGDIAGQIGLGNPYAGTMLEVTRRAQEMPHYGSAFQQRNVFSGYDPQYATNAGLMQRYMNPYTALVTNPMIGEARRQSEISGQQLGLQAAGTGSWADIAKQSCSQKEIETCKTKYAKFKAPDCNRRLARPQTLFSLESRRDSRRRRWGWTQLELSRLVA